LAKVHLLDEKPTEGYPPFAAPSAVLLKDDRIYFGRMAVTEEKGTFFKSLKVQLLPHDPALGQRPLDLPPGVDLDVLIAAYFGWVLGEIKQRLDSLTSETVSLNVAAPMSHIVDRELKPGTCVSFRPPGNRLSDTNPFISRKGRT
jgi:hypothetical protein